MYNLSRGYGAQARRLGPVDDECRRTERDSQASHVWTCLSLPLSAKLARETAKLSHLVRWTCVSHYASLISQSPRCFASADGSPAPGSRSTASWRCRTGQRQRQCQSPRRPSTSLQRLFPSSCTSSRPRSCPSPTGRHTPTTRTTPTHRSSSTHYPTPSHCTPRTSPNRYMGWTHHAWPISPPSSRHSAPIHTF